MIDESYVLRLASAMASGRHRWRLIVFVAQFAAGFFLLGWRASELISDSAAWRDNFWGMLLAVQIDLLVVWIFSRWYARDLNEWLELVESGK